MTITLTHSRLKTSLQRLLYTTTFALLLGCHSSQVVTTPKATPEQDLRSTLSKIGAELPKMDIGVSIVDIERNEVLFRYNDATLYTPASTAKLLTFAAALHRLGPGFRYDTELLATRHRAASLHDLILKGSGDPSLSSTDIAHLIAELRQLGIKRVTGDIIVDASIFDDAPYGDGWLSADFDEGYSAPISGLSIDHNRVVLGIFPGARAKARGLLTVFPDTHYFHIDNRVVTAPKGKTRSLKLRLTNDNAIHVAGRMPVEGEVKYESLAIRAPLDFAGFFMREQLKKNGIAFKGQVKVGVTPADAIRITHHYSAPLSEMSIDFMKMSNNHATETLLKTLGAQSVKGQGTFANGLDAVKHFLEQEVGINASAFMSADGSGLSRDNRISAKLLTDLLSYMWKNFQTGPEFISSLALYGEDGTLKKQNDPLFIKRVRAKTGSMRDIKSLAGYLQLESGKVIGFAVLTNGAPGQTAQKKAIDAILLALGRLN